MIEEYWPKPPAKQTWKLRMIRFTVDYGHMIFVFGIAQFILVFVIDPWQSPVGHTIPFCVYIVARLLNLLAMYVESDFVDNDVTWKQWTYLAVFTISSVLFMGTMLAMLYIYHSESRTGYDPVWPGWASWWIDWSWMVIQ